jgi:hypothetical protein
MSILQMMMAGLSLEYEGVITSGDLHIATKDGEAMFFHDSIDFSSYAGTDGGSTPYRFVFTDSAGKTAIAYGGAAGGGEALGSELVTNGDMELDSDWGNYGTPTVNERSTEQVHNGTYSRKIICQYSTGINRDLGVAEAITGRLAKCVFFVYPVDYDKLLFFLRDNWDQPHLFSDRIYGLSTGSWNEVVIYKTPMVDSRMFIQFRGGEEGIDHTYFIDDVSLKFLTDIPATGLHLMSTKNGTTRNMASVETGFDPNAIVGVKIYG